MATKQLSAYYSIEEPISIQELMEAGQALHIASENGHEAVVRLLLDRGADIHSRTAGDWIALHFASSNDHEAVVRLLLERGADIHSRTDGGLTALDIASENGHEAVVRLLRGREANTHSGAEKGLASIIVTSIRNLGRAALVPVQRRPISRQTTVGRSDSDVAATTRPAHLD